LLKPKRPHKKPDSKWINKLKDSNKELKIILLHKKLNTWDSPIK